MHFLIRSLILLGLLIRSSHGSSNDDLRPKWYFSTYVGAQTRAPIEESLFRWSQFDYGYMLSVVSLGRRLKSFGGLELESELQVAKHFGQQSHEEFNVALIARWTRFPWDRHLYSSFALGEGVSYATQTPKLEAELHDKTNQFLNYLMFEFAFSPKAKPDLEIFLRNHHRSGAWGTFNGVHGGSNAISLGLRHRF